MARCWARGQTEGVCPGVSSGKLRQSHFQNQNPAREGSYRNADMTSSRTFVPSHNINTSPGCVVCVWSLQRIEKSWADWQPAGCVFWPDWVVFNLLIVLLKFSYSTFTLNMTFDTGNSVETTKQKIKNNGDLNLRELMCKRGNGTMSFWRVRLCTYIPVAAFSANANILCILSDDGYAQSCRWADH